MAGIQPLPTVPQGSGCQPSDLENQARRPGKTIASKMRPRPAQASPPLWRAPEVENDPPEDRCREGCDHGHRDAIVPRPSVSGADQTKLRLAG